jgi:uncharacterized membrane protein
MTPRRRAIIIVGLILILIGIIVFAIFFLRRLVTPPVVENPPAEQTPTETVNEPTAEPEFVNPLVVQDPEEEVAATGSRQMAEIFAERYGSYSNQGDYQNLRDLLPIMTARYRQETEAFLSTAETTPGQTFEGVTSVKISTDVRSSDEDSAVIAVTLQQERRIGSAPPTIAYRTLRMELQLVGEDWRIDKAAWEN